jgi:uncharacterized protein YwqG
MPVRSTRRLVNGGGVNPRPKEIWKPLTTWSGVFCCVLVVPNYSSGLSKGSPTMTFIIGTLLFSVTIYFLDDVVVFTIAIIRACTNKVRSLLRIDQKQVSNEIDVYELEEFVKKLESTRLPMVKIKLSKEKTGSPTSSKLGGTPYANNVNKNWPISPDTGLPMLFLAQINFSELPKLDGFPKKGILQLFAPVYSDGIIAWIESAADQEIRWIMDPMGNKTIPVPAFFTKIDGDRTFSKSLTLEGAVLEFEISSSIEDPFNWPFREATNGFLTGNSEMQKTGSMSETLSASSPDIHDKHLQQHWIGGHPRFSQDDIRFEKKNRHLDRVLLHLGFDEDICLGDAGNLNLLINQEDLTARRFSKAVCTWDCS